MNQLFIPEVRKPFRLEKDVEVDMGYRRWDLRGLEDMRSFDGFYKDSDGKKRVKFDLPKGTIAQITKYQIANSNYYDNYVKLHVINTSGPLQDLPGMTLIRMPLDQIKKFHVNFIDEKRR